MGGFARPNTALFIGGEPHRLKTGLQFSNRTLHRNLCDFIILLA
jgi:hypothetical protein